MKGYVYIIRTHQTDDVYYGSTTQMLCKRMADHRQDYKKWLRNTHAYMTSFEILKHDDAYIELVEEVNFENKKELYAREGHHIRENNCVNKCIMGRTWQERREENKEQWNKYIKQWREENRESIKETRQKYEEKHKEERAEYKKKYNKTNKDTIRVRERKYYEANKKAIQQKRRETRLKKKAES